MNNRGKAVAGKETEAVIFSRIYRNYVSGLTGYARRFVPEDMAGDIVHDVFVKVWSQHRFLMPEKELRFYLYRCVLNACRDYFKHRSVQDSFRSKAAVELRNEEFDFLESHLENAADDYILNRIYKQIELLPGKCREIFIESYFDRRKSADIAAAHGISRRTVEAQLYKALKILRSALQSVFIPVLLWMPF